MDGHAAPQDLTRPDADDVRKMDNDNPPSTLQIDAKPRLSYSQGLPVECDPPQPSYCAASQPSANASSAVVDDEHMKPIQEHFDYLNVPRNSFGIASQALGAKEIIGWDKWCWEMRNKHQPVLPYMVIAPTHVIQDIKFMNENNFSLVVILRDKPMANFPQTATDDACKQLPRVDVLKAVAEQNWQFEEVEYMEKRKDKSPNWNPESWNKRNGLQQIVSTLVNHRISAEEERLKKCNAEDDKEPASRFLITCSTGNNWSPIVVAAYIMAVFGKSRADAGKFVMRRRMSCDGNATGRSLEVWEQLLKAAADVTASGASIKDQNRQHLKRAPDSDADHNRGRDSLSPFV